MCTNPRKILARNIDHLVVDDHCYRRCRRRQVCLFFENFFQNIFVHSFSFLYNWPSCALNVYVPVHFQMSLNFFLVASFTDFVFTH